MLFEAEDLGESLGELLLERSFVVGREGSADFPGAARALHVVTIAKL